MMLVEKTVSGCFPDFSHQQHMTGFPNTIYELTLELFRPFYNQQHILWKVVYLHTLKVNVA